MARFVEKNFELTIGGFCGDYEGNCGYFTVRIPLKTWSNGHETRVDSGESEIEWNQRDNRFVPTISFDTYTCCNESE